MNSETFSKEFEKIFGSYKSKRIRKFDRVLSGNKKMISSPYATFLYETGLYLNIPVSQEKLFSNDCDYLFSLCHRVYRRFRKRFRKNCKKNWSSNLYNRFEFSQVLFKISLCSLKKLYVVFLLKQRLTLEFLFYKTAVLTFELSLHRRLKKRRPDIIRRQAIDIL